MSAKPMAVKNEEIDLDDIKDVEIELEAVATDEDEANPNVEDQLSNLPEGEAKEERPLSAKDEYQALLKKYPDMQDLYGEDVKKRIGKLTYEAKEEARQKEEAIKFARNVQEENKKLKAKQTDQDGAFLNEHTTRLDAQLNTAKKRYQEAYQANDAEAMAEANADLALAASQLGQAQQTSERFKRVRETAAETTVVDAPYQPAPARPDSQRGNEPVIDPKAQAWAEKNTWFGEDQELSNAALTIHEQLVRNEGYLPQSDAYYKTLDERLIKNYPESAKLMNGKPQLRSSEQSVAPVNSQLSSKGSRKVKLTASQVKVARALGVPLAEYAKYVV